MTTPDSPSAPFQHLTLTLTQDQYDQAYDALYFLCRSIRRDLELNVELLMPERDKMDNARLEAASAAFDALILAGMEVGFEDYEDEIEDDLKGDFSTSP
jgi:hypothetical protein